MGKQTVSALQNLTQELGAGGDVGSVMTILSPSLYVKPKGELEAFLSGSAAHTTPTVIVRRPYFKNCVRSGDCQDCRMEYVNSCLRLWNYKEQFPWIQWKMCGIELEHLSMIQRSGFLSIVIGALSDNEDPGGVLFSDSGWPKSSPLFEAVQYRVQLAESCSVLMDDELFDLVTDLSPGISQAIFTPRDPLSVGKKYPGTAWEDVRKKDPQYVKFLIDKEIVSEVSHSPYE